METIKGGRMDLYRIDMNGLVDWAISAGVNGETYHDLITKVLAKVEPCVHGFYGGHWLGEIDPQWCYGARLDGDKRSDDER